MKLLTCFKSGFIRTVRSWMGLLIIWVFTLFLVSMVALPMKAGLKSVLGKSMVTELFTDGLNIDVLVSFGSSLPVFISSFFSGFVLLIVLGLMINIFLTGGLFTFLQQQDKKPTAALFFSGAASNFWSFLIITVIVTLMILVVGFIVMGIPAIMSAGGDSLSEDAASKIGRVFSVLFVLILPIFILVADYARSWQVSNDTKAGFRAIGYGFSQTFRTFLSSYPSMILLLAIQFLYGWVVLSILKGIAPSTGMGLFLLFLFSQLLVFIKILLKSWRYGTVIELMSLHHR